MLAINSVFFEMNPTPTLIFDEVDTGVGGLTAIKIGELLRLLSEYSQVICITHLPQIAQLATTHIGVEKRVINGQTYAEAVELTEDKRANELKRMMGGDAVLEKVRR